MGGDDVTAAVMERLPAGFDEALAAAVDDVFARKGLSFEAEPRYASSVPAGTDISNAILGAQLMGFALTPQGVQVAGVLEAKNGQVDSFGVPLPLFPSCVVEVPRRSTKTTVIQMVLLGRCANTPGYRVVSTAQDGTRASQFFMNMVRLVEGVLYKTGKTWADIGIKQVYRSQGREYIEWFNGSRWWVVKPESSAFRGEAADVMWFDEAGELNPETSADLMAGALPIMDTRELGQIIISGTPGLVRAGMFWDFLEKARKDPNKRGIVDYCANEWEDPSDEAVWWRNHPGLASGLTHIDKLRERFELMPIAQFAREYLCIWPADRTVSALDKKKFEAGKVAPIAFEQLPEGTPWAASFECHMEGMSGSIIASWWQDGVARAQVMEHRAGVDWMPTAVAQLLKAHPSVPVVYDPIGQNQVVAQQLAGMPRVNTRRLRAMPMREVSAAASMTAGAVDEQNLQWGESKSLMLAVENANWRFSGENRFFGRKSAQVCISGIIGLSLALFEAASLKAAPKRRRIKARVD